MPINQYMLIFRMADRRTKNTKSVAGSYNDQAYIDAYVNDGVLPEIHEKIGAAIKGYAGEHEPCMDLGSCTGLLAIRAVTKCGRSMCVGVEGNEFDFDRSVRHSLVTYRNYYVERGTLNILRRDLLRYKPTLVIARRVFPEIAYEDPTVVTEVALVLRHEGVKKIILQGRVPSGNPVAFLHNAQLEAERLAPHYSVKATVGGDVIFLEAN